MSYREHAQKIDMEWFEIWYDEGLMPPYLLLLSKAKGKEEYSIFYLMKSFSFDRLFYSYDDAFLFLIEDEYTCVKGREVIY